MGLLASLFGVDNRDPVEIQLERDYATGLEFMGSPRHEAQEIARDLMARAKQMVRDRHQEHQPPNVGDTFLQMELTSEKVRNTLQRVRLEGVTNDDIRDWWNRPPIERALFELIDELDGMTVFINAIKKGHSPEEAGVIVRKIHPVYGNSTPKDEFGEDRVIPWELRARITRWREKYRFTGHNSIQRTNESTSFNALVRSEMRSGRL